jgi:CDP-4-dehydro-6-deoxyglucose reductase, E1
MSKYPLSSTTWDHSEIQAINEVIESGNFTMGLQVAEFEKEFASYAGGKYSVMVNSGSSANLVLLSACRYMKEPRFNPGDEIIAPAVSWSTTYYPIDQNGATIKFVDISSDSLNIDVSKIEEAITSRTKAIFVVNLLGNPADWEALEKIAQEYNLTLLEDNAESLGGAIGNKKLGTFGFGGTHSTFFSHHMSTMEGGLVVTDDEVLYQTMKSVRAHGWTRDLPDQNHVYNKTGSRWDDLFRFVIPGYNLRPLEIEAAIGRMQLKKLPSFIDARRKNAAYFLDQTKSFSSVSTQVENGSSSWFGFSLVLKDKYLGKRAKLLEILESAEIESRPIVTGNFTRNPVIKHLSHAPLEKYPSADLIHDNGLFVGNHHYDLKDKIDLLCEALTDFERSI